MLIPCRIRADNHMFELRWNDCKEQHQGMSKLFCRFRLMHKKVASPLDTGTNNRYTILDLWGEIHHRSEWWSFCATSIRRAPVEISHPLVIYCSLSQSQVQPQTLFIVTEATKEEPRFFFMIPQTLIANSRIAFVFPEAADSFLV